MTKPSPEREILEMAKLPGFVVRLSYAIALLGHDCDGCNHSVAPRHETVMSITNFPVARNISDSFDAASVY
jgi:hypothetical protein